VLGRRTDVPTPEEVLDELDWVIDRAAEHFAPRRARRYLRKFYPWCLDRIGAPGAAYDALERSDGLSLVPGGGIMRAEWVPVRGLPAESLAFDHADMLRVAMNRAQSKLRYSWLAFQVLPETVTLPELRAVYAAIVDPGLLRLNTGNFKKAFSLLFASGVLVPVGRRAAGGRVGRPGDLYRFTGPVMGTWERELPWHDTEALNAG